MVDVGCAPAHAAGVTCSQIEVERERGKEIERKRESERAREKERERQ